MTNDIETVNFNDIEKRARQMRAEAARDGFNAMRRAVVQLFAMFSLTGRKTA